MKEVLTVILVTVCVAVHAIAQAAHGGAVGGEATAESGLARLAVRIERAEARVAGEDRDLLFVIYHHLGNAQQVVSMFEDGQVAHVAESNSFIRMQLYAENLMALNIGRDPTAIAVLKKLEAQDPKNTKVLYLRGMAEIRRGDLQSGLECLQRAADLDYAPAHLELARWDPAKKQFHYRQAILHGEKGSLIVERAADGLLSELERSNGASSSK